MKAAFTIILAATAISANAEFLSGNQLLGYIKSSEVVQRAAADGYVMGVHDLGRGVIHCSPTTVSLTQLRDMTAQLLEASPSIRHQSADHLVALMMAETWPCPKKAPQGRGA